MITKRQTSVLVSGLLITAVYWFVALWYTNKQTFSKDLVVFRTLFGCGANYDIWQYIFQFAVAFMLFVLLPFCITRCYLKADFFSFGIRFILNKEAIIVCLIIYPIVIASTYYSAQEPLIAAEYPLSKAIGTNWTVFVLFELSYFFYFFSYEIFYRGFFSFGLRTEDGGQKELFFIIVAQTLLTTVFHFGKPFPEVVMAAVFGPIFGIVAFRYNSIWYGMIIHYVMNVFLDYFSLYWLGLTPKHFY